MTQELKIQQALTLSNTFVKNVSFKCGSLNPNCTNDSVFNVKTEIKFVPESAKIFIVEFIADLKHKENPEVFNLNAQFVAVFQTAQEIDNEFKNSPFAKINAPAIAFPFLRSFVAGFITNAGYNPIIMPSINFAALTSK